MRIQYFLALVFGLGAVVSAQRAELNSVFEDANKLYLAQKYDAAISQYQSILKNGYESGAVYFNLGNAYYKSGNIPAAILNYERAKKFLSGDEDLKVNLQLANMKVIDKIEPIPELPFYQWANSLLTIFSVKTMLWLMYALYIVLLASFTFFLFAKSYAAKRFSFFAGMFFSLLLFFGIVNYFIQSYREANTEFAVIMSDVANIKSAPDSKGNDLFILHGGIKVQVLDGVNKWRKIKLADGKVGWIPDTEIEII
ncbi:MAG: SH3 domain-containing protein [Bacteroidetes bacterium]|nr:SH3 domain-containing protein [Bacteroidota bacterium]